MEVTRAAGYLACAEVAAEQEHQAHHQSVLLKQ